MQISMRSAAPAPGANTEIRAPIRIYAPPVPLPHAVRPTIADTKLQPWLKPSPSRSPARNLRPDDGRLKPRWMSRVLIAGRREALGQTDPPEIGPILHPLPCSS